ncbi:unnamed protein product [Gadus morhua 'NCC']
MHYQSTPRPRPRGGRRRRAGRPECDEKENKAVSSPIVEALPSEASSFHGSDYKVPSQKDVVLQNWALNALRNSYRDRGRRRRPYTGVRSEVGTAALRRDGQSSAVVFLYTLSRGTPEWCGVCPLPWKPLPTSLTGATLTSSLPSQA